MDFDRLRSRLRQTLGSSRADRRPRRRFASRPEDTPLKREPRAEGRLLVWRERFLDRSWSDRRVREFFAGFSDARTMRNSVRNGGIAPEDLLCIDLETCGFSDVPVFLVGTMISLVDGWELVQWLAPDPSAEPELISRCFELLRRKQVWVSFNGKSFDIPFLRRRSRLHDQVFPENAQHVDLLHEIRRRWRGQLPDCRLATVERRLLGRSRLAGDIPGREVPDRYYDFVQTGERRWIEPVVEHNRRDVAMLAALLARVCATAPGDANES